MNFLFILIKKRLIEYEPNKRIVLDSESFNKGVPYADVFTVRSISTISYIDNDKCLLEQKAFVYYSKKPNFVVRGKQNFLNFDKISKLILIILL